MLRKLHGMVTSANSWAAPKGGGGGGGGGGRFIQSRRSEEEEEEGLFKANAVKEASCGN